MRQITTRVFSIREVTKQLNDGDLLCLQDVIYIYPSGERDAGIRFMRRGPDGKLKAQRGQANCVSLPLIAELTAAAEKAWR